MTTRGALGQFGRFAVVGAIGFVVDVGVLYATTGFAGWYGGRALSFWAAATSTWWLNRRFTFTPASASTSGTPRRSLIGEYLSYLLSMVGGGIVNYLAYALTLHYLSGPVAPAIGVAVGSVAGLTVNFLLARHVVFSAKR